VANSGPRPALHFSRPGRWLLSAALASAQPEVAQWPLAPAPSVAGRWIQSDGPAGKSLEQNLPERVRRTLASIFLSRPCYSARSLAAEEAEPPGGWCRAGDGDGHGSGLACFPRASSSFSLLTSPPLAHAPEPPTAARNRGGSGSLCLCPRRGTFTFGRGGSTVPPPLPCSSSSASAC
jgi:hypothetical protein